jgi:hypothetical protein
LVGDDDDDDDDDDYDDDDDDVDALCIRPRRRRRRDGRRRCRRRCSGRGTTQRRGRPRSRCACWGCRAVSFASWLARRAQRTIEAPCPANCAHRASMAPAEQQRLDFSACAGQGKRLELEARLDDARCVCTGADRARCHSLCSGLRRGRLTRKHARARSAAVAWVCGGGGDAGRCGFTEPSHSRWRRSWESTGARWRRR